MEPDAVGSYEDDLRRAESDVYEAKSSHRSAVKRAESAVRDAKETQERRIKAAEKKMREAEKDADRRLGSYKSASLYADRVAGKGVVVPLGTRLVARVEIRPRSASGRDGQPADLWRPFLVIESPAGNIVVEGEPDDEQAARNFAAAVNKAAANAEEAARARKAALDQLQRELEEARSDTSAIQEAEAALAAVQADTSKVDEAQAALEDLKASLPAEAVEGYERKQAELGTKALIVIGIVVAALIYVIVATIVARG